jgi:hypothetical protein
MILKRNFFLIIERTLIVRHITIFYTRVFLTLSSIMHVCEKRRRKYGKTNKKRINEVRNKTNK